ncbi:MAG: FkbM family methyltransferase [Gammaproteobacteria bacterium]
MRLRRALGTARRILRHEGWGALARAVYYDLDPFDREFRPNEARMVFELLAADTPAGLMVDVGAHTGGSLRPFLEAGWDVLAFEPDSNNRAILLERFGERGKLVVDVRALSDAPRDDAPFYRSRRSSGISGLSAFHESHREAETVTITTLAAALAEHDRAERRVDFLKIDTEGLDLPVLRGLDWSAPAPRVILCEFENAKTEPHGYDFDGLAGFLDERGYRLLVAEWKPVVNYGRRHDFAGFFTYPHRLTQPGAWGNLFAVAEAELFERLIAVCEASPAGVGISASRGA